ncbi:MAG: hypothetical protein DLM63_04950 [Solirubrobacterales bacterium]|nr:MAG: hypothetical protein DLM63_04950 [Solirubrobacterales bacterium]
MLTAATLLSACGSGSNYANNPRPPSPIDLGTSINDHRVSVSPSHFGAGPVVLVVTNQSSAARSLRVRTTIIGASCTSPNGTRGPIDQSTSPISPQGTGQLQVDLCQGRYAVSVDDGAIQAADLVVGPQRASAQNQVLQP